MRKPCTIESENTVIRVLTVMPTRTDYETLDRMLPSSKWALHQTRSVAGAVGQLLKSRDIPLVLCEQDPWPSTWKEMLHHIRGMSDPPYLIVASRMADERLWAEALNLGAYDVLSKPFDPIEVDRCFMSAWTRWRRERYGAPKEFKAASGM